MNIDVKDKVVIITGASGLIGGAFADAFAEHGAIVIIANRSDDLGIAKAKELIGVCRMSIADTASAVGFSDGLTFNRNFKKIEGLTPTEYKKSCEN